MGGRPRARFGAAEGAVAGMRGWASGRGGMRAACGESRHAGGRSAGTHRALLVPAPMKPSASTAFIATSVSARRRVGRGGGVGRRCVCGGGGGRGGGCAEIRAGILAWAGHDWHMQGSQLHRQRVGSPAARSDEAVDCWEQALAASRHSHRSAGYAHGRLAAGDLPTQPAWIPTGCRHATQPP